MTDDQAARVLRAIERLDEKHDATREQLSSVIASTRNLEGWAEKLNGRLADVTKTADTTAALQASCPARIAFNADTTAGRQAISPERALQVLADLKPKRHDSERPVSMRPEVKQALKLTGAAIGVAGGALTVLTIAGVILATMLGIPLPFLR